MTKKIMLVEPAVFPRKWMTDGLMSLGYEVINDIDKSECAALYSKKEPDLVILALGTSFGEPEVCSILDDIRKKDPSAKVLACGRHPNPSLIRAWESDLTQHGAVGLAEKPLSGGTDHMMDLMMKVVKLLGDPHTR